MFLDLHSNRLFSTSPSYIMRKTEVEKPNTFLYFSYGANILTFRMHMLIPGAEFITIARLDNYRLDFMKYSSFWGGPTATLVPTANGHVWGVIWRLHRDNIEKLDIHKGVAVKKYYVKHLRVLSQYMGYFTARVYIQRINPLPRGDNDPIPIENWPSWTYKEIMVMGATEHNFPEYYIKQLKKIEDNGEEGALRTVCLLIRDCVHILYYEYDSNLLKKRGHKPDIKQARAFLWTKSYPHSVQFIEIGRLAGHQLDFSLYSDNWRGAVATVVPTAGAHVWGAIWRLHVRDIPALDKQEGVDTNRYFAKTVDVLTPDRYKVQCRIYQQSARPPSRQPGKELPMEQRPGVTYLDCIVNGAKECDLPSNYILELMKTPHNGNTASPNMLQMLNS